MTAHIGKELRAKLEAMHETVVEGTRPFIKRGDKTFARFDKIVVEGSSVTYSWQGVNIYTYYMVDISSMPRETLVLQGFTAETEVTIS